MYEDENDDRFEAALRLAEDDPARGAEALRSIVADDAFDPDTRFEAAARLAEVDEAQAAEAAAQHRGRRPSPRHPLRSGDETGRSARCRHC